MEFEKQGRILHRSAVPTTAECSRRRPKAFEGLIMSSCILYALSIDTYSMKSRTTDWVQTRIRTRMIHIKKLPAIDKIATTTASTLVILAFHGPFAVSIE